MAFDPCREWLGIDADDLTDPRRVLGLPPLGGDAVAIARAADARLESLRRVAPGAFVKAHAALISRVENARDTLLAELPAGEIDSSQEAVFPPIATGRSTPRRRRKRGSDSNGLLLSAVALLGVAVAVLAFMVLRPDKQDRPRDRTVAAAGNSVQPREPKPVPDRNPEPSQATAANQSATDSAFKAEQQREQRKLEAAENARRRAVEERARRDEAARLAAEQARRDEEARMATEQAGGDEAEPADADNAAERAGIAAAVNDALEQAYQALRREDFDTADRLLSTAEKDVGDDVEAATRLRRWQLLAGYAREFTRFRGEAFAAANAGREYEVDGEVIAIIEITPDLFIYRQDGRNKRVPRGEVDRRLEMAIVETWFAGDGRAANHLFLGAGWLCHDPPALRRARAEWQIAGAGGEQVAPLIALLDDPVLRQVGR
jgi:cytoskeletal protein RodZ